MVKLKNTNPLIKKTYNAYHYLISKTPINNLPLSQLFLVLLTFIMAYFVLKHMIYYNIFVPSISIEGFDNADSNKQFIMKKNNGLFDDFYASIYDTLVYSDIKNAFELNRLSYYATIDQHSNILDIGCGTGHHVAQIADSNAILSNDNIIGIDISKAMVNKSQDNYPALKNCYQLGDATDPTLFRDDTFSHILCLYFTIYYIKDKYRFFKNCHTWLQPGGIVLLHLVDRDEFDPIIPAGNPLEIINVQNYSDKRITSSKVAFNGFNYQANFDYKPTKNRSYFTEKFIYNNGKTRQNEHTFYMETQNDILTTAKQAGFIVKEKNHMHKCGYEKQYLYILEKTH